MTSDARGPPPSTGSQAFGDESDGTPKGSQAFGGADSDDPLRGALLFGNDPKGNPAGSEAFGGANEKIPLRGAILFGNDPRGNPTGSEAFGGADDKLPLRGALVVGNDARGNPRGSETFGTPDEAVAQRGSQAFGAGQGIPERLKKDAIGYDFAGVMLVADDSSIAGVRKDTNNRLRQRIVRVLGRRLEVAADRLRHGLGEDAVPWGKLKRRRELDRDLAYRLRKSWRLAPGEVLGVAQVRDLLEAAEQMHSYDLRCEWDLAPVQITVRSQGKPVAYASSALHKEHSYFIFKDTAGAAVSYVDALVPRRTEQRARIRDGRGATLATLRLVTPSVADAPESSLAEGWLFRAELRDSADELIAEVKEQRASSSSFLAQLALPDGGDEVGEVRDELSGGKIRTVVELDLRLPGAIAWGLGAVLADLARLRRRGWPKPGQQKPLPDVESIEAALGPRRR
jgi:hypothetical protein